MACGNCDNFYFAVWITRLICDKRVPAGVKRKTYNTKARPAMLCVGDGFTEAKTGSCAGGGRGNDVKMRVGSEQTGQDSK